MQRAYVPERLLPDSPELEQWPFKVPCVSQLVRDGLSFESPVTFLVGDNGSGKSTLVEAIAEAFNLDAHGGRAGRKYGNDRPKTLLGELLRLDTTAAGARMLSGPRARRKGFFLRAETAFGLMNTVAGMNGYWDEDTSQMSHGEGFLTVFGAMFQEPGFYVLDEPESALSFTACLQLVSLMHELAESGAQVVCATHSPILAATPGADIIEIGEHGLRRTTWQQLELVDHWRRFLDRPDAYLRHLVEERGRAIG